MKKKIWLLILAFAVCTSACSAGTSGNVSKSTSESQDAVKDTGESRDSKKDSNESQDSFTSDKSYSYDKKYYALQSEEQDESANMIKVSVYMSETDELIYEFVPARARDFWGICWESGTYNIWIQSGDIGVMCYAYKDETWILDDNAKRPKDIISKYD